MRRVGSAGALLAVLALVGCAAEDVDAEPRVRAAKADGAALEGDQGLSSDPSLACATSIVRGESVPLYLVFMVDRSKSMEDAGKWTSVVSALSSFLGNDAAAGISASLQFFPGPDDRECNVAGYEAPAVPMTRLPDRVAFGMALAFTSPWGITPSRPALEGALAYARRVRAQHPDGRVAVVLATDGEPLGCRSSVENVSSLAARDASTVPTYVIGVGDDLRSLDAVAQSGGTKQAILVSATAPAQIAASFLEAVQDIRQQALGCEYKVPPAPPGQTLDAGKVNVRFTPRSGGSRTLAYSRDCSGGDGWRYDDASRPTKINLCPSTCDTVKADRGGRVSVFFGCTTVGGAIR